MKELVLEFKFKDIVEKIEEKMTDVNKAEIIIDIED